jgi:hypothetical protein
MRQEVLCRIGLGSALGALAVPIAAWEWSWPREVMAVVMLAMLVGGIVLFYRGYKLHHPVAT